MECLVHSILGGRKKEERPLLCRNQHRRFFSSVRERTELVFSEEYVVLDCVRGANIMALTQIEKDDVYITVSIELVKMFDVLTNAYSRPESKEKAQLIIDIEKSLRKDWEHFKLPA